MADQQIYPPGAYVTVRGFTDGWAAVVAHEGAVLSSVRLQERAEAFRVAERKAERDGLPCLITRGAA
ncbi:hypothetical protein [Tabrizicola sp. YIM 78059]|uniref:hypothetical protein n=1 Tax=Tabrizicola sp. YIM 78059 TaxID=2529861 RepID=UPI0010AA9332|nr:hypothetical protein [Tabrizicola sp. YIM 78059]